MVLRLPDNAKIYLLDFTVELNMYCTAAEIRFETENGIHFSRYLSIDATFFLAILNNPAFAALRLSRPVSCRAAPAGEILFFFSSSVSLFCFLSPSTKCQTV